MHRNYFLFKRQVDEISPQIIGQAVCACFSHRKDELVIEIGTEQHHFLRIGIKPDLPYLLFEKAANVKEPKIAFFPELKGQTLGAIQIESFDKYVTMQIGAFEIHCIFFGRSPNIIVINTENGTKKSFKSREPNQNIKRHDLLVEAEKIDLEKILKLKSADVHRPVTDFLSHHIAGFNKLLAKELVYRSKIESDMKLGDISDAQINTIVENCRRMAVQLKKSTPMITVEDSPIQKITLLPLTHRTDLNFIADFKSVNEAWIKFVHQQQVTLKTEKLRKHLVTVISRHKDYLQRTLKKIKTAEDLEQRDKEAKLKGNLLLTFMHEIKAGEKKVKLKNIFSDSSEDVEIKLNPAYSVAENARRYFDKFKNIEILKDNVRVKKDTFQSELHEIETMLLQVESAKKQKQLKTLEQECIDRRLIQSPDSESNSGQALQFAFNRILLAKKWDVFIGKNAKNNDLLTLKFAHKFDLWFHAQGVPGSHVIIRLPAANAEPPKEIIEQAAAIAAWYSNARHSNIVPVNYTLVRFVRKPRKAPAGAVTISREKTLFVKPQKMS